LVRIQSICLGGVASVLQLSTQQYGRGTLPLASIMNHG